MQLFEIGFFPTQRDYSSKLFCISIVHPFSLLSSMEWMHYKLFNYSDTGYYRYWLLQIKLLWIFVYRILYEHIVIACLFYKKGLNPFPEWLCHFAFPSRMYEWSKSSLSFECAACLPHKLYKPLFPLLLTQGG